MDPMQKIAHRARKLLRNDWDCMIAITGKEGTGKSEFTLQLAKMIDPDFTLRNVVYRFERTKKLLQTLPRYSAVQNDEFQLAALNRSALSKANVNLVRMLTTCRQYNQALLVDAPSFWILDAYVRNHRTAIWIHLPIIEVKGNRIRGFAKVRIPRENEFGEEPYFELISRFRFQAIPGEVHNAYREHKAASLLEEDSELEPKSEEEIRRDLLRELVEGGLKQNAIAKALGVHPSSISRQVA